MHFKYVNESQENIPSTGGTLVTIRNFFFLEIFLLLLGLVLLINYCEKQFFSDLLTVSEQENSL